MESVNVKDLMVPIAEYATVSEEATLFDAVMALEKAQEKLDRAGYKYLHRAVIVLDDKGNVVGKISQLDALRVLEPKYGDMGGQERMARAGFSPQFLKSMMEKFSLLDLPLEAICSKAAKIKVKNFMYTPGEGEYITEDDSLCSAVHLLVMGNHQSLLVMKGDKISGILRLTDVFMYVFDKMKTCEI